MQRTLCLSRLRLAIILFALVAVASTDAAASRETLEQVRARIERDGLSWTAGETSISRLPPERWRSMLGTAPPVEVPAGRRNPDRGHTLYDVHPDTPVVDTAWSRFTWTNVDGEDWTTDVKNQGACGSCAVFASVAGVEALANISAGVPDLDLDLSEQNLLSCTTGSSCQSGTWDTQILIPTLMGGIPDETCHPYEAQNGSCSDACGGVAERSFSIAGGGWLPSVNNMLDVADQEEIRSALVSGPVIASFVVPESFSYYTGGVYDDTPTPAELISAWHTVLIVGWDDHVDDDLPPSWMVKNSWGTGWGVDGFFEIVRGGPTRFGTQATVLDVDASIIENWICIDDGDDDLVVQLETGSGGSAVREIEVRLCKGEGPVPFKIESRWPLTWLTVSPMEGQIAAGVPVTLMLTYDEAAYDAPPGTGEWNRLFVVAPRGHTRRIYTELWSIPAAANGDTDDGGGGDDDGETDADLETGAEDPHGGGGATGCGCRAPGAGGSTSLVGSLLALLSR